MASFNFTNQEISKKALEKVHVTKESQLLLPNFESSKK